MAFSIKVAVLAFITAFESISGTKIAILERQDTTEEFWVSTASILCEKTEDGWCDSDVQFLKQNTEPTGYSQIIEYKNNKNGETKRVCAILPPIDNVDPSYMAEAFTGTVNREERYPSNASTYSWLMLYHAAHCLDSYGNDVENKRAIAFASLGLTILQGDPAFAKSPELGQSRLISIMIKKNAAHAGVGQGERLLFDYFKSQAASVLRKKYQCNAVVRASDITETRKIARANKLDDSLNCEISAMGGMRNSGLVSDENLWIWMYGRGGLGAPPMDYEPAAMFSTMKKAATYTLQRAQNIANE